VFDSLSAAYWELGRYQEGLAAGERLVGLEPSYFPSCAWSAMNAVDLGRKDDASAALAQGKAKAPALSIHATQGYFDVSRPQIDKRRNATLRSFGL
jgi:tetratricopeptide (TPR) repeat protein